MARMTPRKSHSPEKKRYRMSKFDQQVNDLLRHAMAQPGVAEAMKVYGEQQQAMDAFAAAQSAVMPRWVMSTSSSTRQK